MARIKRETEVIKIVLPRDLAERFRKYAADKYGSAKDPLSKAVIDIIEKEMSITPHSNSSCKLDELIGLGLNSDYLWEGEDVIEAIRRRLFI